MLNNFRSNSDEDGWIALAKHVVRLDEERIQEYKQELHALLLQTGILSLAIVGCLAAAMNTFLERTDGLSSVWLMGAQYGLNCTFSAGVCTLCFASFVLSLITASLIISVRTRLTEHLARYHRSPQDTVQAWLSDHVDGADLEILDTASVLPSMLRFTLGTFFVGLCFLAWVIHPLSGSISTLLVSLWAINCRSSARAHISPRTPYNSGLSSSTSHATKLFRLLSGMLGKTRGSPMSPETSEEKPQMFHIGGGNRQQGVRRDSDIDILSAVDSILLDDYVLSDAILESLGQSLAKPEEIVQFVLGVIRRRLPGKYIPSEPLPSPLDLHGLSFFAWGFVARVTLDAVEKSLEERRNQLLPWPAWMGDALMILLAHTDHPLGSEEVLSRCLAPPHGRDVSRIIAQRTADGGYEEFTYVLTRLRGVFAASHVGYVGMQLCLLLSGRLVVGKKSPLKQSNLQQLLEAHPDLPESTMHAIFVILMDCAARELTNDNNIDMSASWNCYFDALSLKVPSSCEDDLSCLIQQVLMNWALAYSGIGPAVALVEASRSSETPTMSAFKRAFVDATTQDRFDMVKNIAGICTCYARGDYDDWSPNASINPLRVARLMFHMLKAVRHAHGSEHSDEDWSGLWVELLKAINAFQETDRDAAEQASLAEECLILIDAFDAERSPADTDEDYTSWFDSFDSASSLFSDDLIDALGWFAFEQAEDNSRRLRRWRAMRLTQHTMVTAPLIYGEGCRPCLLPCVDWEFQPLRGPPPVTVPLSPIGPEPLGLAPIIVVPPPVDIIPPSDENVLHSVYEEVQPDEEFLQPVEKDWDSDSDSDSDSEDPEQATEDGTPDDD